MLLVAVSCWLWCDNSFVCWDWLTYSVYFHVNLWSCCTHCNFKCWLSLLFLPPLPPSVVSLWQTTPPPESVPDFLQLVDVSAMPTRLLPARKPPSTSPSRTKPRVSTRRSRWVPVCTGSSIPSRRREGRAHTFASTAVVGGWSRTAACPMKRLTPSRK